MVSHPVHIHNIFISPNHNFFGHHGQPADRFAVSLCTEVECVAGSGIVGDRFFNYKPDYKGQITFFDWSIHQEMLRDFPLSSFPASVYRRNVIISGISLDKLIGARFRIGPVSFCGTEECKPCYWMDEAVGPGAEAALKGKGGLRARILESGKITAGSHQLECID